MWNPDVFNKAWFFATLAHSGQTYGGPEPGVRIDYLNHIGSVTMEVLWALEKSPGRNKELAIQCAILHDVIEDTRFTFEDIQKEFGAEVAAGVLALTKDLSLPKEQQMKDSLARIRQQPQEIWMVKLADRITNLYQAPFYWDEMKKRKYAEEAAVIHDTLKEASPALAERLREKMERYSTQ